MAGEKPPTEVVDRTGPAVALSRASIAACCSTGGIDDITTLPAGFQQKDDDKDTPAMIAARAALAETNWRGRKLVEGVAISGHESGGWNPTAANKDSTARGLWQIMLSYHQDKFNGADWRDPRANARVAGIIEGERGDWSPWESWTNGGWKKYEQQAEQAVRAVTGVQGPFQAAQVVQASTDDDDRILTHPPECEDDTDVSPTVKSTGDAPGGSSGGSFKGRFPNGQIPARELCPVPHSKVKAHCDAARAFGGLTQAYAADMGRYLPVTDGYRNLAGQWDCQRRKGNLCATPGTSNHGWGVAFDLGGGVQSFGTSQHRWMQRNAGRFGFVHPSWAQRGGSKPEPWHWEFVGGSGTRSA